MLLTRPRQLTQTEERASIHNYYERLVIEELTKQMSAHKQTTNSLPMPVVLH